MKLRNKKTGEVIDAGCRTTLRGNFWITRLIGGGKPIYINFYESLAELNEEWEDYKPAEPLIKDEKIRKAVRAWAEANHINRVYTLGLSELRSVEKGLDIEFSGEPFMEWATENKTIAELCGEETPEPLEPSFIDLDERIREREEE